MPHPTLLFTCPSPLCQQLRHQTDYRRSTLIRTNYKSQFAQLASELAEFRDATTGLIDEMEDGTLSELFRRTVPFTSISSYEPFISRFFETPCKASSVLNLLSPGLPDYLFTSSSTSGGAPKFIPIYKYLPDVNSSLEIPDPLQRRTSACIWHFWCKPIYLTADDNSCHVKTIYQSSGSSATMRATLNLHPERDEERMSTFIFDHAAPYAAGFIKNWRSMIIIHALFALHSRGLKTMSMTFVGTFVDMMRYLDVEFDLVVDCIANGTIPDLEGLAEVRHHLEINNFPDPERAAELRDLGRPFSRPGWCSHAWPGMQSITTIAGGSFATSIPLAQWLLGSDVAIHDAYYASTETMVAYPYSKLELNQYKITNKDIIEFLDIRQSDSISALSQIWEVEQGKRYEAVLTTRNGLWRYRLGDVVEVSGFDPTDGTPVIRFIERRNAALRFIWAAVNEEELRATVSFMVASTSVQVVGWTTSIDDRRAPNTVGFFIELADGQVADLAHVTDQMLEGLSRSNQNITQSVEYKMFRKPTVRLVRPGTFCDFLQLKIDEGSNNVGQLKVPVVLPKMEYVKWFADQVIGEL